MGTSNCIDLLVLIIPSFHLSVHPLSIYLPSKHLLNIGIPHAGSTAVNKTDTVPSIIKSHETNVNLQMKLSSLKKKPQIYQHHTKKL